MKSFVLVLVVVFAFFADSGSTRDINDVIFHALDVVLRNEMRNGNPYTGFPVMAPYQAPEEAVSLNFNQLVELDGNLQTVRIDGLDGYSISEVNLNLATMRLNFDFTWPQLLFTGRYNLNGRFAGLIPIFGQGSYHIDPKSVRGSGYATIQFVGPNSNLHIADMNVRLNLQSLSMDIQGILGGGDLGELINKVTENLIPSLLVSYAAEINESLGDYLLPKINPYLNSISLADLEKLMP